MKSQTPYRGGDNKKVKLSKADKVYNAIQKMQKKAIALQSKKSATN